MTKYIFVTGGVTSSLGKGIIAASLAKLLQAKGLSVTIQKFDPYINIDPGTMNPLEHGECYVTDDGAETDLDLGHYERFLGTPTSQENNVTTGRIYQTVIENERKGYYLGSTVQVIPHITDEIKRRIELLANKNKYDIIITELGGTVGDIESLPYLEAVRQMQRQLGNENCVVIHLTLLPYLRSTNELKTKPTQHSVKELQMAGIIPDILVCRTEHQMEENMRRKISLFCNVEVSGVIEALDVDTIYDVPLMMLEERLDRIVLSKLRLQDKKAPDLTKWRNFLDNLKNPIHEIKVGLVGKYTALPDAYKSIYEAFKHAGAQMRCRVVIDAVNAETLERGGLSIEKRLENLDGILVAPGFGDRGIEGKIKAVQYARENKIPFFGICLGLQCAVVEFSRNVLGLKYAASSEVNPDTPDPVIDIMESQKNLTNLGGTMRLGAYECKLKKDSNAIAAYGKKRIAERHRHRYEINNLYLSQLENAGLRPVGINPDTDLVEIMEITSHPWFVGVQFHPEYKSTVETPHPLFLAFINACIEEKKNRISKNYKILESLS
jgi:CTP synthase